LEVYELRDLLCFVLCCFVLFCFVLFCCDMEEHFILRVPQSVAERLERILNEDPDAAADGSLDLAFQEDGRTGCFTIGEDRFPASLLDLPCVLESYKTYDDNVLIKTADIGQMIMVREDGEPAPEGPEYKHGLTPAMRDARRRRFRREPDLNPDLVQQVENDLQSIMAGGTARDVDILFCYFWSDGYVISNISVFFEALHLLQCPEEFLFT